MKNKATVNSFMAYGAIAMLVVGIIGPTFPLFLKSVGFPVAKIGLLVSVAGFTSAILSLFFGTLSDRFDRRWLLGFSSIFMVTIPMLYYRVHQAISVVGLRVADGIAGPLSAVAADSMLIDLAKETGNKGSVMGTYRTVKSSMFVFGPMIGGLIITLLPIRQLFLVEAALLAGASLLVILALMKAPVVPPRKEGPIFTMPTLLRDKIVLCLLGILLLDFLNFQSLLLLFPVYAADMGVSYGFIGTLITVQSIAYALLQYPIGKLTDAGKVLPLLTVGAILHGPLIWALTLSSNHTYWIVVMALIGVASAPAHLAVMLTVSDAAGENTGAAMGLIGSIVYFASALGPLLSGLLSSVNMKAGFLLPVISSALIIRLAITVLKWHRQTKLDGAGTAVSGM